MQMFPAQTGYANDERAQVRAACPHRRTAAWNSGKSALAMRTVSIRRVTFNGKIRPTAASAQALQGNIFYRKLQFLSAYPQRGRHSRNGILKERPFSLSEPGVFHRAGGICASPAFLAAKSRLPVSGRRPAFLRRAQKRDVLAYLPAMRL